MSADPHAAEWRQLAAELHALAECHLAHVFAWIDAELATSGSRGAVAFILALRGLDDTDECPLGLVISDLLLAADLHMPCAHAEIPARG